MPCVAALVEPTAGHGGGNRSGIQGTCKDSTRYDEAAAQSHLGEMLGRASQLPWEAKALHALLALAEAPGEEAAARSCHILQAFSITDGRKDMAAARSSCLRGGCAGENGEGFWCGQAKRQDALSGLSRARV